MSDIVNKMLGKRAYGADSLAPMVDVKYGAQMGYQPNFKELPSNTPYVRRNLIPILVQAPRGFQYMDNPDLMVEALKVIMEEHPLTIEGIQGTLTPDFVRTPVGGSGQELAVISDMKRSVSAPAFSYQEKYGKALTRFFEYWMTGIMMDPETKYPTIVNNTSNNRPTEMLSDFMSCVMLFIEPDPTHQYVVEAALVGNMQPAQGVQREMSRNMNDGMQGLQFTMEFTAVTQMNAGVRVFAQQMLDRINLTGVNPNNRPAFVDAIDAHVKAADKGYVESINEAAQAVVTV